MKRCFSVLLSLILIAVLTSCAIAEAKWQEQYDLGVRYLSESNYEEAIIAFTAAIKIDPKQAPAYVGRGDAYIGSGEAEENLSAAQTDYEKAIELDEALAEAYLGLAEVYIRRGDYEMAEKILRDGLEKTENDPDIEVRLTEIIEEFFDLAGQWKQINSETEDLFYGAVIEGEKIELHRVSDDGGTRYLYWAGSYVPPEIVEDSYSWVSQVGSRRTDSEAIAASEGTKVFTYENGQLSCSVKNDGEEATILMEKEEWAPGLGISNVPDELVSGYDPATDQAYTVEGITFTLPEYLNRTDEIDLSSDLEGFMYGTQFYTIEPDYHYRLSFVVRNIEGMTQEVFNEIKAGVVKDKLESLADYGLADILSKSATVAGQPAWNVIMRDYLNYERHGNTYMSDIYSPYHERVIQILGTRYDGDLSGYDYEGDFLKMLETARLAF